MYLELKVHIVKTAGKAIWGHVIMGRKNCFELKNKKMEQQAVMREREDLRLMV